METPLINLALLETLKTERFSDEIDLFLPFIAVTIREIGKPTIEIADVQAKLSELFGFRPPISAIKVLLSRAKNKKLLIKENHALIPCAEKINEWSNGYQEKKEDLEISLGSLKKALVEFTLERFHKDLSLPEAESLIFKFIEGNVSATVSRRAYSKAETDDSIKNTNHIIASFVGHIHKKEALLLEHFGRCVKGMLLANYLHFADKITTKKTFEKISVYLDSPLVIALLGFNGSFNKQANEEFIGLLKSLKINVYIFDKTYDEVEGLLSAWKSDIAKKNYQRFNTKTLELLRSQGYDEARLDTEIKTLQSSIENHGITIKFGFSVKERYQCDEVALEHAIAENFRKDKNLKHDTICISRVHNMREARHIKELSDQFSVFVTGNTGLAKYANGFFSKNNYRSAIPVVVSEQWMTIMFWLKNPNISNKLPTDQIVATAYSLLYTDDKFWEAFLNRLGTIQRRGAISEEDFILVRWDADLLKIVQDVSVDVGEDFSEEDIFDIVAGIKNKHFQDSEKTISELQRAQNEELEKVRKESQITVNELLAAKDELAKRHTALENNIKKFSGFIAWSISLFVCFALVASLIIAASQALLAQTHPELIQSITLSPYLSYFIYGVNAAWGISSWLFGFNVSKATKSIKGWIAALILNLFTK